MTELNHSATPQKYQQMRDAKLNSLQRTTHSQLLQSQEDQMGSLI